MIDRILVAIYFFYNILFRCFTSSLCVVFVVEPSSPKRIDREKNVKENNSSSKEYGPPYTRLFGPYLPPHAWPHTTRAHKYMQTKGAAGYLSWRMSGERIAVHFVCIFLSILDEFNPLSSFFASILSLRQTWSEGEVQNEIQCLKDFARSSFINGSHRFCWREILSIFFLWIIQDGNEKLKRKTVFPFIVSLVCSISTRSSWHSSTRWRCWMPSAFQLGWTEWDHRAKVGVIDRTNEKKKNREPKQSWKFWKKKRKLKYF